MYGVSTDATQVSLYRYSTTTMADPETYTFAGGSYFVVMRALHGSGNDINAAAWTSTGASVVITYSMGSAFGTIT